MPPPASSMPLRPSLVDRLTDPDCMTGRGYDLRRMIERVRLDLEDLLNTRRTCGELDKSLENVRDSIVAYGLPDLNTFNGTSASQVKELGASIAAIIDRFEPRLRKVRVKMVAGREHGSVRVRFHIDAELNTDPCSDVDFETVLELTTGKAIVQTREGPE